MKRIPEPLDQEETTKLMEAARGPSARARRDLALIAFLASTGARSCEAARAERRHLDLRDDAGRLRVVGKGGKVRTLAFGREAAEALHAHLDNLAGAAAESPWIFATTQGLALQTSSIRRTFARLGRRAGVVGAAPHRLRHSLAVALLRETNSLGTVMKALGHSRPSVTDAYLTRLVGEEDVLNVLERRVIGGSSC